MLYLGFVLKFLFIALFLLRIRQQVVARLVLARSRGYVDDPAEINARVLPTYLRVYPFVFVLLSEKVDAFSDTIRLLLGLRLLVFLAKRN